MAAQSCPRSTSGTSEPTGSTIVWPKAAAIRYPSPVEPVSG